METLSHTEKYQVVKAKRESGNRRPVKVRPIILPLVLNRPKTTLHDAVMALMNNGIKSTVEVKREGKSLSESKISFPPELVAVMRGLFGSGKTYKFQLHNNLTFTSSGAGAINSFIAWSPLVSSYAEWTALSALFDEVKITDTELIWTAPFASAGINTGLAVQIALAPDEVTNGAASSGFNAIQRIAESHLFSSHSPGTGGDYTLRRKHRVTDRPYATTTAPAGVVPPNGCTGQWSFASNIAGTVTDNYAYLAMCNVFKFRARA